MKKLKIFINYQKEEEWLNQMLAKGYILVAKNIFYTFKPSTKTDGVIAIDYQKRKNKEQYADYILFFEDAGWQHLVGKSGGGEQYFISEGQGDLELFSDGLSAATRYKRKGILYSIYAIMWLIYFYMMGLNPLTMLHPNAIYLTPNLFEKTGSEFWRAFLFETPFAIIFRLIPYILLLLLLGLSIISFVSAFYQYSVEKKESQVNRISE